MAKHLLSLEVPDTLNTAIIRIIDTSVYVDEPVVSCPVLEITAPGFAYCVQFGEADIQPGFIKNFTACDLELQSEHCNTIFNRLPDGIYVIRYSISPNDIVFVEYNHLRVTNLMNRYERILCDLDLSACDPDAETTKKMEYLREIRMYIDAAKAKVQICHEPRKGMELYTYAKKLLDKFSCKTCY